MGKNENREQKKITKEIGSWLASNSSLISFYGRPFQSNKIFIESISDMLKENKKILYIWGKEEVSKSISEGVGLHKGQKIAYSRDGRSDAEIVFMNFKYTYNIVREYDLVIVDDISTYFRINKESLEGLYKKLLEHSKKIILFTINSCSFDVEGIDISHFKMQMRFLEPRLLTTRIDLNKDIPSSLYDYLLWFIERKKKVVVYFPYQSSLDIFRYYCVNELKLKNVKILVGNEYKNDLNLKDRAIFIITNNMEEVCEISKLDSIVTLFAENYKIDYKKILYMCGKVTTKNSLESEVILVGKSETKEIETAKDLTRKFNKKLWEEEYIKL